MRSFITSLLLMTCLSAQADSNDLCRLFNICPNGTVIDGVSYVTQSDCESDFVVYPYTTSPFINNICQDYQTLKQQTQMHNRMFFVKKQSTLAASNGDYFAIAYLDNNPRFEFYIDYGVANALEVSELARIYQQHGLTGIEPYNGEPLQVLSMDMLAEFSVISTDERHQAIEFDISSGVEFFKNIEIQPYPQHGFAYVSIGLTELGQSVISQSLIMDFPLYGLFSWRANHTFGDLTLTANGDLGCVKAANFSNQVKLIPCEF